MRYSARINIQSSYIPFVTLSMIALLILCFLFQSRVGAADNPYKLNYLFSISSYTALTGHTLRLFTANLFHVNLGHLLSNLFGLVFFSSFLEIVMGRSRVAIIILLSALGGTIGSLLFHMVDWMVGSSTILFGVFGGLGVLIVKYRRELHQYFIPAAISWCISLIPLVTLGYLSLKIVDQGAHAGGFVAGVLSTSILAYPHSLTELNKRPSWMVRVILIVLLVVFGLSLIKEVVPLLHLLA